VERAVKRGVRIRMLTNSIRSNNHLTAHSAYRNHIRTLLDNGAELHEVRIDADDRDIYMLSPIEEKKLALHAKALVIDDDKVFIGSANLDPRSLRINTEMGLDEEGGVIWVSHDVTLTEQPAASMLQRIEDWFFSHLPIENEL
jgi:putative cardiolipin synthase